MAEVFNVYCDESCHLEHDRQKVMVLGAIWCPLEKARETAQAIGAIKENLAEEIPQPGVINAFAAPNGRRKISFYTWQMS